jgi:peptidoglycan hydrolase-like protein with peptidoglycan-binding domain
MALQRLWMPSPCYSSRGGSKVRLIVVHTSEGAQTIQSLANWFANAGNQVSSHTGIDNASATTIGEYVKRDQKAWTSANANPVATQTELCTPSGAAQGWSAATWAAQTNMLAACSAWIAEEAAAFGIPIVKLTPQQAQGGSAGVCGHGDLGSWGGGHTDPGPNFPWSQVIAMATGGTAPAPAPPKPTPTPPPASTAPPFPWPSDNYIGPPSSDPKCHSGHYGPPDSTQVAKWQSQMIARGWSLSGGADGDYGPSSQSACRQFQQEKGLGVDGLVGPQTWSATWTAPVT